MSEIQGVFMRLHNLLEFKLLACWGEGSQLVDYQRFDVENENAPAKSESAQKDRCLLPASMVMWISA